MKPVFKGMHRPFWEEFRSKMSGGYVACSCGSTLQTQQQVREHWQMGHFDEAVYEELKDSPPTPHG